MNCFNHPQKAAVGICKHCHKGLCPDCIENGDSGISCRGACAELVRRQHLYWTRASLIVPRLIVVLGAVMVVLGISQWPEFGATNASAWIIPGVIMFLGGAILAKQKATSHDERP